MKDQKLTVKLREGKGRGFARRLRAQGQIPAVIYGKSGNRSLTVGEKDFRLLMRVIGGKASVITLNDDQGGATLSLIQDTQRNPRTDRFEHIDFHEVVAGEKITTQIPVHTFGEAYGVKNENGVLEVALHEVEIECLPKDLPEDIQIDVTELHSGSAVHISDLKSIEGVTFHGDPATVVVAVSGGTGDSDDDDSSEEEKAAE